MKITCKLGTKTTKVVEVSPNDPLQILLEMLQITDKHTKFHFNGTTYYICSNFTFKEIGIYSDSRIFINNQAISGGGGEESNRFANLSEEFIRKDNVSEYNPNIPKWRTIGKGINLYGICQNSNCVAKGKQVIKHVDSKEYDVYNEGFMGICPMCNKHFDLDTCSFYHCDYKCEGTYFDKSKDNWVDLPGDIQKTSGGKDFYYDYNKPVRGKEGKVKYKKLVLKVIQYHDSEYDNK